MRRLFLTAALAALGTGVWAQATGTPQSMSPEQNYYRGRQLEATAGMAAASPHYLEAVRVSNDQIARGTATGNTYVFLTRSLRRLERHSEVVDLGRQGMRAFPTEYRILEAMGQSFFFLGNYAQSLAHMERYASAQPNGESISVAYFFIGEIFRLTNRFHRADMAYTTAMFHEPNMDLWWFRLGEVRERVGDREPAMEAYRRAVALNPAHGGYRQALARLQAE